MKLIDRWHKLWANTPVEADYEQPLKPDEAPFGFSVVRIIHGKGIGVQREMVRKILGRTPFVTTFYDAPPQAGGLGATVAELELPVKR